MSSHSVTLSYATLEDHWMLLVWHHSSSSASFYISSNMSPCASSISWFSRINIISILDCCIIFHFINYTITKIGSITITGDCLVACWESIRRSCWWCPRTWSSWCSWHELLWTCPALPGAGARRGRLSWNSGTLLREISVKMIMIVFILRVVTIQVPV